MLITGRYKLLSLEFPLLICQVPVSGVGTSKCLDYIKTEQRPSSSKHHVPNSSNSYNSYSQYPASPSLLALDGVYNTLLLVSCARYPLLMISPHPFNLCKKNAPSSYFSGSFLGFFFNISIIFLPLLTSLHISTTSLPVHNLFLDRKHTNHDQLSLHSHHLSTSLSW